MATKHIAFQNEIVKKSNALIRGNWKPLSIWEPRIVALVASKVRESDEDFYMYKISVAELAGVNDDNLRGNQYQEIAKSIEHLGKAFVRIQGDKPRNFRVYSIFATCGYENGNLIAQFHPDLKPHFLNLGTHFTEYNFFEYLKLPSIYSQKIFELLKSWNDKPEITISVIDLHDMLSTPESFRKDFRNFRLRVLEKSYKDITEKTTLRYEWETIKQGRSVESVRFTFGKKRSLPVAKKKTDDAKEKQSQRNNAAAITAMNCLKERGETCAGGHQKKSICDICLKFRPQESCQK